MMRKTTNSITRSINIGRLQLTLMTWTPMYDGAGRMLNHDPNTITRHFECRTCGRQWATIRRGAEVKVQDV